MPNPMSEDSHNPFGAQEKANVLSAPSFALLRHMAVSCMGCGHTLQPPIDERSGVQDFKRLRCTVNGCKELGKVYMMPTVQLLPG